MAVIDMIIRQIKKGTLNCDICDHKTKQQLKIHTATQHSQTGHDCYLCGYQAYKANLLEKHMMTQHGKRLKNATSPVHVHPKELLEEAHDYPRQRKPMRSPKKQLSTICI